MPAPASPSSPSTSTAPPATARPSPTPSPATGATARWKTCRRAGPPRWRSTPSSTPTAPARSAPATAAT
jgi:hypothetical protein